MDKLNRFFGLTLGGGGVRGISYIGVFKSSEERRIHWGNMAGVSVGSLMTAIKTAGYNAIEMQSLMDDFNFQKMQKTSVSELPIIKRYKESLITRGKMNETEILELLNQPIRDKQYDINTSYRGNILNSIVTLSNEKALYDGDYLEDWIYKVLALKEIRTFKDLRGGFKSEKNPNGYKIRMTCVDCTRVKLVVLPDDLTYYGINPDNFEVAKAVRISSSIPFVFSPVTLNKNGVKYNLIDGGVFDNFPFWLIDNSIYPAIGFKIKNKKNYLGISPINILQNIVSAVYDIGIPYHSKTEIDYIKDIEVSNITTLDFNLSEELKTMLIQSGYIAANNLFAQIRPYFFTDYVRRLIR